MFIILFDCSISRTFPLGGFFPRVLYVQTCQTLQTGMERCVLDLPPLHAHSLVSGLTMWILELSWKKIKNSWKIWRKRGRGMRLFEKRICHKNIQIRIKYFCIGETNVYYQVLVWQMSSEIKLVLMHSLKQLFYDHIIFSKL